MDDRTNRALQADLAAGLRELGVDVSEDQLGALCLVIIEASNRLLDIALQAKPAEAALVVAELKKMLAGLLRQYLGD